MKLGGANKYDTVDGDLEPGDWSVRALISRETDGHIDGKWEIVGGRPTCSAAAAM